MVAIDGPHPEDAAWGAGSLAQKCDGMADKVLAVVDKQTTHLDAVNADAGTQYVMALSSVCDHLDGSKPAELATKKKGFELAKRLTDVAVPPNTRRAAVDQLVTCDPIAAKPVLTQLTKNKEPAVSTTATNALSKLADTKK